MKATNASKTKAQGSHGQCNIIRNARGQSLKSLSNPQPQPRTLIRRTKSEDIYNPEAQTSQHSNIEEPNEGKVVESAEKHTKPSFQLGDTDKPPNPFHMQSFRTSMYCNL